jgi:hypothetical protein
MDENSLQDIAAPGGVCYGCGSSNPHGLHISAGPDWQSRAEAV